MVLESRVPVITIDGPSGTGKGTICHMLANHLRWHFLDSGALYRVLAFASQKKEVDTNHTDELVLLAKRLNLSFQVDKAQNIAIILDGEDISRDIRSEYCGQLASKIAAIPEVREALLARQRAFAIPPGLVTDGRDMGTIVFPKAILKIYLDANVEERANRRYLQLKQNGNDASLAQVIDELRKRDTRDMHRLHAPLKPAADAVIIDTTGLTVVQVFDNVLQLANKRLIH